jgi:hypothetical protein
MIFPLSWTEYCDFRNLDFNGALTSEDIGSRKNAFHDYMKF